MRVLVIAHPGQIRDALEKQLSIRNRTYSCAGPEWIDREELLPAALNCLPGGCVVVNALTLQQVAGMPAGELIDQLATLTQACGQARVPLVHLSSSAVFDGLDAGVHRESEPAAPSSREGGVLLRAEELVAGMCSQSVVLRCGPMFSANGENILADLLKAFKRGDQLELSDSGDSAPIHVSDMARVVSAMLDQLSCGAEVWGTYHYCSADYVSHYQFAAQVLQVVRDVAPDWVGDLNLVALEDLDDGWYCPLLNCEKILNTFGIKQLPWRAFVAPTIKKYFDPAANAGEPLLTQSIQSVRKENFDG